MKKSILNKWIKALRSGEYLINVDQTVLVEVNDNGDHIFHPLAVLADIAPQKICDFGSETKNSYFAHKYVPILAYGYSYITAAPNDLCDWADISTRCSGPSYLSKWPRDLRDNVESIITWIKDNV